MQKAFKTGLTVQNYYTFKNLVPFTIQSTSVISNFKGPGPSCSKQNKVVS